MQNKKTFTVALDWMQWIVPDPEFLWPGNPWMKISMYGLSVYLKESLEPGIYMEGITDKAYQIPYPSAGSESLLTRLEYIHEKKDWCTHSEFWCGAL